MQDAGFPAVRLTEATENYNRQHQDVRVENGVALRRRSGRRGLSLPGAGDAGECDGAGRPRLRPAAAGKGVKITGAVSDDTTVSWAPEPGAADLPRLVARNLRAALGAPCGGNRTQAYQLKLDHVNIDDWVFGVSSVSADGWASPVEFPGPVGAFERPDIPAARQALMPHEHRGRVLIIAGSDSRRRGGRAGGYQDRRPARRYAATAITAITVQNTLGVSGVFTHPARGGHRPGPRGAGRHRRRRHQDRDARRRSDGGGGGRADRRLEHPRRDRPGHDRQGRRGPARSVRARGGEATRSSPTPPSSPPTRPRPPP